MHTPSRVALSLGLVLCLCHSGWANDSTFGGAAGALAPLKESRVRMASEDILLEAISRTIGGRSEVCLRKHHIG